MGLEKNSTDIAAMFDSVAFRYDFLNSVLSFGQERYWRRRVFEAVEARCGDRLLDLAAGTGVSSEPFVDAGVEVTACDFSYGMIQVGKRRRPDINFVEGDATDLPFDDNAFDAVTISFGLRNVSDPMAALSEMLRVVKPGGKIVVAEFSTPKNKLFKAVYEKYLMRVLPWIASKLMDNSAKAYGYLSHSIQEWPGQDKLAAMMFKAGWQNVKYVNLTGGVVALHRGYKQFGPERNIRQNGDNESL